MQCYLKLYEGEIIMLLTQIDAMKHKRGKAYIPRTRHKNSDGSARYTNRLFLEDSPYLLQHAHNPVNWYPWKEDAFLEARRLNRPLFVSIGYSTCHWCHVMEEESFEDEDIADYLNKHFICVKVDREERPDVDAIYMAAVQALTGSGGWPLNVFLTPSLKPFFGGTYFPARDGDRGVMNGFFSLLKKIIDAWEQKPIVLETSSDEITRHIQGMLVPEAGKTVPGKDLLEKAALFFKQVYDPIHGGMKGSPKFPSSFHVRFLIRAAKRTGNVDLENMVFHSLEKMAYGGMYDQIGGGFHRYSTDSAWLVPHFEKMLYDNALLVMAYVEAYQASQKEEFKRIAREIIDYLIREMRSPEGGFYSATDADSITPAGEKEEGFYFTWTPDELEQALGDETACLAKAYFSMDGQPDFEGRHIPHISRESMEKAKSTGPFSTHLQQGILDIKETLYTEREKRKRPLTDTKILSSWNGLMISALARAGIELNEKNYTDLAETTAGFIIDNLFDKGRLRRSYTEGTAKLNAYLDDYAFVTAAFLDLYKATSHINWLNKAKELDRVLEGYFEDMNTGGFFMTSSDHELLIAREKPWMDGALPSGNSVAILNLLRLYTLTQESSYLIRAEKALCAFSTVMEKSPGACGEMLVALDYYYGMKAGVEVSGR